MSTTDSQSDQPQQVPSSETPWWSTPGATSSIYSQYGATETPAVLTPATQKPERARIGLGLALIMALLAGVLGSLIGVQINDHKPSTKIVTSQTNIERAPNSIAGIAARVSPSVVSISVDTSQGSDSGSGFFIASNGYILTNNHVIESAATSGTISVTLSSGKNYSAKIVGRDSAYDLAVLKIDVTNAPALTLGDSDKVQVGDAVIAIGSPLGLSGTVTSGIISAKNRPVTAGSGSGENSFINALQTDAAVNPGNSGGPLVDISGAVIGVNSAIASLGSSFGGQSGSIGLGFAIPINQAQKTADQLIKTGASTHPIMGLSLDNSYSGEGAKVANVAKAILVGGPAEKAGLKPGDIILAFQGKPVANSDELIVAVRSLNVGDVVSVKYRRGSIVKTVNLTLIAQK